MAYIVDYAITENAGGGATSVSANVPQHQANDYLIMFAAVNGTAGGTSGNTNSGITVTGWTQIGTFQIANSGIASAVYYVRATTSTTTCTVAITTADDYSIKVISVRDADQTTFLDGTPVSSNTGTTASSSWTSGTFSTTQPNSLIIYYHALDGITPMAHTDAGTMFLVSSDSTGTTAQTSAGSAIAWYVQRTAGPIPAASWSANISTQRTDHIFAIRNVSNGVIPAYIDDSETQATRLHSGLHVGTLNNTVVETVMTATASINGKTMGTSTPAVGADFGINPYSNAIGNAAAIVARTNLNGYQITLTGGRNLSTGLIVGNFIARTPKEARYGIGATAEGGLVARIGNSATAWNSYQLAAKDAVQSLETRSLFAIQAGYTGTTYGASQGTAVTTTGITFFQIYYNAPLFASIAYLTDLYQVFKTTVAGGTATVPVDIDGLTRVGNSYRLPLIKKTGSAILSYTPIQIGGGDAVNFQVDSATVQFPGRNNATTKDLGYHAADNALGLSLAGKSGDIIYLTNSVITSPIPYYFNINAVATSAATWNLSGTTIINANVTLRPVYTFDKLTFSACPTIDITACTITNSILSLKATANNSLTVTSTTSVQNCTLNTTQVSSGIGTVSLNQTTGVPFSTCIFEGSSTSGHAIIITQPGSYSFNSLTFTGYGGTPGSNLVASSGSTSAAIYNNSGGSVTISVNGGTSFSVRNGSGASTTLSSTKSFVISNIVYNSELRLFRVDNDSELAGVENIGVTAASNGVVTGPDAKGRYTFTYSHSLSNVNIKVIVISITDLGTPAKSYQPYYQETVLDITSDQSLLVSQILDRNYSNPV